MTWELIGAGRQRLVYRRTGSNYVLKVPCNDEGFHDNGYESRLSRTNGMKPDINGIWYGPIMWTVSRLA